MKAVIKREIKNFMKNPIIWIGVVVVLVMIYPILSPYLTIGYFKSQQEVEKLEEPEHLDDVDILDGYIVTEEAQQYELGLEEIKRQLVEFGYTTKEDAEKTIHEIKENNMSFTDIDMLMAEKYEFYDGQYILRNRIYKGNQTEINSYIDKKLAEKPFSYYFSMKFADFAGLFMCCFAAVLLAFLFIRDTKRDTYELLHAKPISAGEYIAGKIMGGFCSMLIILAILDVVFTGLCMFHGMTAGLPVRVWDLFFASIVYIIPNILMITCVYALTALVFKNPLPGFPVIFLYIIYSNMGSIGPDGQYGYYGRHLAIMVRFPERFFENAPLDIVPYNQVFLIAASLLIITVCIWIWKKRRVYR